MAQKVWTTRRILKLTALAGAGFTGTQLLWGSECFYSTVVMPIIHQCVDPETAHRLAVQSAKYGLMPRFGDNKREYGILSTSAMGLRFRNPIGIAAGFDKDGEAIEALLNSGLGFVEIGSVTPKPQPGNEKPRVFRLLEDKAVINRYGFNSAGVGVVSDRVKSAHKPHQLKSANDVVLDVPLGVNLGKNKDSQFASLDYEMSANYFANHCEYLVINVSSPNTPGLRALQSRGELENILAAVNKSVDRRVDDPAQRPKILLKITSDLSAKDLRDVANVASNKTNRVDGLIISNTTLARPDSLRCEFKHESGGLSGAPLKDASTRCIKEMYKLTGGQVPIVGCGGVASGQDAYEKIRAGASLVQFYTALVYEGFPVVGKIKRELRECLLRDGFGSVNAAVGVDVQQEQQLKQTQHNTRSWWRWWW